jgi:PhnB protein
VLNEDGAVGHAEFKIGDTILLAFDSHKDWLPTPAFIRLYVNNAAATYQQALVAGATPVTEPTELAWGDVVGRVRDPLGNVWWVQERKQALSEQVLQERFQDPDFLEAMKYVQESFSAELRKRKY